MGFHTYDVEDADRLEDAASRYRYCSAEELLGFLGLDGHETVADLGSGTGFYTDDVAERLRAARAGSSDSDAESGSGGTARAGSVHAVDVQEAMHDRYREKGVPDNVSLVTAAVADMPFDDGALDAAFSTMTYHEFHSDAALDEVARVLRPAGRLVLVDWSADGSGESGPPVDERYTGADARRHLQRHGFTVRRLDARPETWAAAARRTDD